VDQQRFCHAASIRGMMPMNDEPDEYVNAIARKRLDEYKKILGIKEDQRVAELIGVRKTILSKYVSSSSLLKTPEIVWILLDILANNSEIYSKLRIKRLSASRFEEAPKKTKVKKFRRNFVPWE
jgi:hypothetical protein